MRRAARGAASIAAAFVAAAVARAAFAGAAHPDYSLPVLYTLDCSGCHGEDGRGVPAKGVPNLHDAGRYAATALGRRYLIEVPGVAQSPLTDRQVALMLNYILERFADDTLPKSFKPYALAEVAQFRADVTSDPARRLAAVLRQVHARDLGGKAYAPIGPTHATQREHRPTGRR